MPRLLRRAMLAYCLLAGLCGCGSKGTPAPRVAKVEPRPIDLATLPLKYKDHNVVFVSFDALQAAHVGYLGYERDVTPTLDAFAQDCFILENQISVASWTVPSSMSWFTGVYPSEHRLTNKFAVYTADVQKPAKLQELASKLVTLAQILKANGYATSGFTGNAGVSAPFGFDQGFDIYFAEKDKFGSLDRSIPEALAWVRANRTKKFFLFLHGYDCHGQSAPVGGCDYRFVDRGYDRKYTGSVQEQEVLREEGLDKGHLTLRDADVRFWRAIYDEKIQRADAKFKRFLDEFAELGLMDKTLFIITSDHGTEFYEHRRFDHGFTLYQEQIHVPLLIKLPGQKGGGILRERHSSLDLMPTILDLLDVDVPSAAQEQMRGQSLVAAIQGEAAPRDIISETDYRQFTYKRSLIAPDGWKLIYSLESRSRELYDLNTDPAEQQDFASSQPQLADELEQRLFAHFRAIGHDLTTHSWEPGLNPVYNSQAKGRPK
ncbi:MAG: sulfatase [Pirellulaceae bacterium]|nr:sulfatase [Pirellulaceae bacterium]